MPSKLLILHGEAKSYCCTIKVATHEATGRRDWYPVEFTQWNESREPVPWRVRTLGPFSQQDSSILTFSIYKTRLSPCGDWKLLLLVFCSICSLLCSGVAILKHERAELWELKMVISDWFIFNSSQGPVPRTWLHEGPSKILWDQSLRLVP